MRFPSKLLGGVPATQKSVYIYSVSQLTLCSTQQPQIVPTFRVPLLDSLAPLYCSFIQTQSVIKYSVIYGGSALYSFFLNHPHIIIVFVDNRGETTRVRRLWESVFHLILIEYSPPDPFWRKATRVSHVWKTIHGVSTFFSPSYHAP